MCFIKIINNYVALTAISILNLLASDHSKWGSHYGDRAINAIINQKSGYKTKWCCPVSNDTNVHFVQAELYNEYAAEDKLLNFHEFYELYKVERSTIEVKHNPSPL